MSVQRKSGPYVLLTAAYNEEAYIENTIRSVLGQSLIPQRWVIVSDNSTDRTDEIVNRYAKEHDFIKLLRVTKTAGHNFGAKVIALKKGEQLLDGLEYDFIGNLDADISLESNYFEELISRFTAHPSLGITSGFIFEDDGKGFKSRWFNSVSNVPHAAQLVRRECYEEIGGYAILRYGGEDWYAQTQAKMKGWQVEALPTVKVFHHRHTGMGSHPIKNAFRLGRMDFTFGSDPLFEVIKCIRKFKDRPYLLAGFTRFVGFASGFLSHEETPVPPEFKAFLQKEQRARVTSLFRGRSYKLSSDIGSSHIQ
jgi:poly-beta-1,6-N-acetyl-D-glucosamine synthase